MTPIQKPPLEEKFLNCLQIVLEVEGGCSDDPHDPGGRTFQGITQREYDAWRKTLGEKPRDVCLADSRDILDIYYKNYWLPWGGRLWVGLDQMYFDQCVNQGRVQATKNLQRAVNNFDDPGWMSAAFRSLGLRDSAITVDGKMGPQTFEAVSHINGRRGFLATYYDQDMNFYRKLQNWYYYGRGWTARATKVYQRAMVLFEEGRRP